MYQTNKHGDYMGKETILWQRGADTEVLRRYLVVMCRQHVFVAYAGDIFGKCYDVVFLRTWKENKYIFLCLIIKQKSKV